MIPDSQRLAEGQLVKMGNDSLLPNINHIVLLMFENRSFDNMLGGLYPASDLYDGLTGTESNPVSGGSGTVQVFQAKLNAPKVRTMPYPDPGELFTDMNAQILGNPPMQGFAENYAAQKAGTHGAPVARDIMQYFLPANVPITTALAQGFAVSDAWFGSGPTQTFPNRAFSICGTPGYYTEKEENYGRVDDVSDYLERIGQQHITDTSVFQVLDDQSLSWKVYYNDYSISKLIVKYVHDNGSNCVPYDTHFGNDVENGLPTFSIVEPRYARHPFGPHANSNHPGGDGGGGGAGLGDPIDVYYGEQFLADVYNTIYGNPDRFADTLLIVTYDEHGGLYDHVPPPMATSPFDASVNIHGFDFSRYGPRVPIILVNPYIAASEVTQAAYRAPTSGPPFDHTSIVRTIFEQWNLSNRHGPIASQLTPRDGGAPPLANLLGSQKRSDCVTPAYLTSQLSTISPA